MASLGESQDVQASDQTSGSFAGSCGPSPQETGPSGTMPQIRRALARLRPVGDFLYRHPSASFLQRQKGAGLDWPSYCSPYWSSLFVAYFTAYTWSLFDAFWLQRRRYGDHGPGDLEYAPWCACYIRRSATISATPTA